MQSQFFNREEKFSMEVFPLNSSLISTTKQYLSYDEVFVSHDDLGGMD